MDDKTLLSIPDHVPVGAVIGRGGSFCKSLREKHGVRCTVDSANRTVALRGRSPTGLQAAESELTRLFASFGLKTREDGHTFEVAANNGPARLWSFHQVHETSLNDQLGDYLYRLHQSGSAETTPSLHRRFWINEFREDKMENTMTRFAAEDPPPKLKVSFGELCFKLQTSRCHEPSIGWSELQRLRIFKDFRTRWSNFCRCSNPSIAALLDDLEGKIDKGLEPRKSLAVHLTGYEGKSFDLKYHLVDGQWKLHNVHGKRCVRSTCDVVLDNDISFRLRAVTSEKISDGVSADIQRILKISIPDGDFFGTEVTLREKAPRGLSVKFSAKAKIHVEIENLCFSVSYLDTTKNEIRLECRLSVREKQKLTRASSEAQVLLEQVMHLLSRP